MDKTPYSSTSSPALFRAKDRYSDQEMYFKTSQEACEWMLTHRDWILAKREVVNWTFPLEKIIAKECWVNVINP